MAPRAVVEMELGKKCEFYLLSAFFTIYLLIVLIIPKFLHYSNII